VTDGSKNGEGKSKARRPGGKMKRGPNKWNVAIKRALGSRSSDQHIQAGGKARSDNSKSNEQGGCATEAESEAESNG